MLSVSFTVLQTGVRFYELFGFPLDASLGEVPDSSASYFNFGPEREKIPK